MNYMEVVQLFWIPCTEIEYTRHFVLNFTVVVSHDESKLCASPQRPLQHSRDSILSLHLCMSQG
jgi:hypothetical protein